MEKNNINEIDLRTDSTDTIDSLNSELLYTGREFTKYADKIISENDDASLLMICSDGESISLSILGKEENIISCISQGIGKDKNFTRIMNFIVAMNVAKLLKKAKDGDEDINRILKKIGIEIGKD